MSEGLSPAAVTRVAGCVVAAVIPHGCSSCTLGLGSGDLRNCDFIIPFRSETKARTGLCHSQGR